MTLYNGGFEGEDDDSPFDHDLDGGEINTLEQGYFPATGVDEVVLSRYTSGLPDGNIAELISAVVTLRLISGEAHPQIADFAQSIQSGLLELIYQVQNDPVAFIAEVSSKLSPQRQQEIVDKLVNFVLTRTDSLGKLTCE